MILKKFNDWFEKWFGPVETTCSQCGEKYMLGVPGYTHKCNLKKVIKKAIIELADEGKLNIENKQ